MKTKYLIGGGLIVGGGVLYYFMSKNQKTASSVIPNAPTYLPTKTDVVVTDTSVLDSSIVKDPNIDPKMVDTFTEVINDLAPQVITEEDKKQEALAQYFADAIAREEKNFADCVKSNSGTFTKKIWANRYRLKYPNFEDYVKEVKCGTFSPIIEDYKMKLQQIGYGYSLGKIYKIR